MGRLIALYLIVLWMLGANSDISVWVLYLWEVGRSAGIVLIPWALSLWLDEWLNHFSQASRTQV